MSFSQLLRPMFLYKDIYKDDSSTEHSVCVPVAQWLSIASATQKVVGSVPREHTYWQKNYV